MTISYKFMRDERLESILFTDKKKKIFAKLFAKQKKIKDNVFQS